MQYLKKAIPVGIFFLCLFQSYAQDQKIADSLAVIYEQNDLPDTAKYELLTDLSFNELNSTTKGLVYAEDLISLSQKTNNDKYLRIGYFLKGTKLRLLGNIEQALDAYFKSAEFATASKNIKAEGESYVAVADVYSITGNHSNAMLYYSKAISLLRQSDDSISLASALLNAGDELRRHSDYDSAIILLLEAKTIFYKKDYAPGKGYSLGNFGMVYANQGKNALAEQNLNEAIEILQQAEDYAPICDYLTSTADIYNKKKDTRTALGYALKSITLAKQNGLKEQVKNASLKLSEIYEQSANFADAFQYYKKYIVYSDSLSSDSVKQKMADQNLNFQVSQKQAKIDSQKNATILLLVVLALTILIILILLNQTRNKRKAYRVLNLQRLATEEQKSKAENALVELQAAQKQLIHSAKMASLGEVTAGIAHEIQNPLNFVNNFSEMSVELLTELKDGAINKLSTVDKAEVDDVIESLSDNLKKINDHGQRADAIVKGMLQHTRGGTGKKDTTDINALAAECMRLSYHGMKAKDKTFDATFTTDFDNSMEKMEVVPQEIARLFFNLYNNAFYSVYQKKKQLGDSFEPLVTVTTKKITSNKIEIIIKDNGNGISEGVVDKIFQPFYTTKPTGQGTGLGLSLSYDIVKAHDGELTVKTKEGEYAEFTVQLPVNTNGV